MTQSHRMLRRGVTWAVTGTTALLLVAGGGPALARGVPVASHPAAAPGWVNAWQGSPTAGGTFSHETCR